MLAGLFPTNSETAALDRRDGLWKFIDWRSDDEPYLHIPQV